MTARDPYLLHADALVWAHPTRCGDSPLRYVVADVLRDVAREKVWTSPEWPDVMVREQRARRQGRMLTLAFIDGFTMTGRYDGGPRDAWGDR